tara:strand:- start:93 stop:500 length:408 start_codon:yes stop_codon:yes gene_type:complete
MGIKSFLFLSLLFATNICADYLSVEFGKEVAVNDWILIEEVTTKDKEDNVLEAVYKYCVITKIIDETKKTPSAYSNKNKIHPLNAVGFVWFIINGIPVQSFTTRYIFQDALTGRRDMTLPESCTIKLQIEEGSLK